MSPADGAKFMVVNVHELMELQMLKEVFDAFREVWQTLPPNEVLDLVIKRLDMDIEKMKELGMDEETIRLSRHLRSLAVTAKAFNEAYDLGYAAAGERINKLREQAEAADGQAANGLMDFFNAVSKERGEDVEPN